MISPLALQITQSLYPDIDAVSREALLKFRQHVNVQTFTPLATELTEKISSTLALFLEDVRSRSQCLELHYVTVNPSTDGRHYNVVVMRYDEREDDYTVAKVSGQMMKGKAQALAESWASAGGWSIR